LRQAALQLQPSRVIDVNLDRGVLDLEVHLHDVLDAVQHGVLIDPGLDHDMHRERGKAI
jgi:hypothetical protein